MFFIFTLHSAHSKVDAGNLGNYVKTLPFPLKHFYSPLPVKFFRYYIIACK